jgi:hypothetical protein
MVKRKEEKHDARLHLPHRKAMGEYARLGGRGPRGEAGRNAAGVIAAVSALPRGPSVDCVATSPYMYGEEERVLKAALQP